MQDYSAYFYPCNGSAKGSEVPGSHRTKQQGRLKLCSRGLLFEPADRLQPLVKYPFRHMETQMEPVSSGGGGRGVHDVRSGRRAPSGIRNGGGETISGEAFRFRCTVIVESRLNDQVTRPASCSLGYEAQDACFWGRAWLFVAWRPGGLESDGSEGLWPMGNAKLVPRRVMARVMWFGVSPAAICQGRRATSDCVAGMALFS